MLTKDPHFMISLIQADIGVSDLVCIMIFLSLQMPILFLGSIGLVSYPVHVV